MSKIKNGGLDQYGAGPLEQQQFGTAGIEGVKAFQLCELCPIWHYPEKHFLTSESFESLGTCGAKYPPIQFAHTSSAVSLTFFLSNTGRSIKMPTLLSNFQLGF